MKALFKTGEKIVCIDSSGEFDDDTPLDLIEGKTYTVASYYKRLYIFGIMLVGCKGAYDQTRFIKQEIDHKLDNEIHSALKGFKIYNP